MSRPLAPTLVLVLLVLAPAGAGCRKERPGAAPSNTPGARGVAAPARGLAGGHPALAKAVRAVLEECEISDWGVTRACKGEADKELVREERAAGERLVLRTYCRAQGDDNHLVRALAAARLGRQATAQTLREQADDELLRCLTGALGRARRVEQAHVLARAAVHAATALRQEAAVLLLLGPARDLEVRAAGYEALWANGRLRLLDKLARLLRDLGEPRLRVALVEGFARGGRLDDVELPRVCGLLEPLLADRMPAVAGAAANTIAVACPGREERLLAAAEERVARGAFDALQAKAVRAVCGFLAPRASAAQRQRAVALLQRVAEGTSFADATRAAALTHLAGVERKAAVKLARALREGGGPLLRAAADPLLQRRKK